MKLVLAVLLLIHGIAHLVGFAGAFALGAEFPHRTTLLRGRLELGEAGTRGVGVLWAALALVFAVSSIGLVIAAAWVQPLILAGAALSLALCLLNLPDTRLGLAVNAVILAGLLSPPVSALL